MFTETSSEGSVVLVPDVFILYHSGPEIKRRGDLLSLRRTMYSNEVV